ncbi:MAG TPA: hypothetical protein VEC60_00735 [Reyranella sp.]|nr:hypothetical protein [Reyranella sp.]
MWAQADFRKARLKAARDQWRLLRPNEAVPRGRVGKTYLEFHSGRSLGRGIRYSIHVQLVEWCEPPPTFTVRCLFEDTRIGRLRERVGGVSVNVTANCEVLAAHDFLAGRHIAWDPPVCEFDAPEDELVALLAAYSKRLDELWAARGGYDLDGFRSLALWLIWHRHRTGVTVDLGEACAAYLYGDTTLALTVLEEAERMHDRLAREDLRSVSLEAHAWHQANIDRLRDMIQRNPTCPGDEL